MADGAAGGPAIRATHPARATHKGPRDLGAVNWIGLWTLYHKEVRRFLKILMQTLAAPVITALLFYLVFAVALGGITRTSGDVPFLIFLGPGLIIMTMAQNAFANTSGSLTGAKMSNILVDTLMPPLSIQEWALAYTLAGITRGLATGLATAAAIWLFVPLPMVAPWAVVFFGLAGCMLLALMGIAAGIWADKFDHISAVTNFVVTPLTFLSGTFYSVDRLPQPWWAIAHVNPFFFMIDGFRYGFIGRADAPVWLGALVLVAANAGMVWLVLRMLRSGYRLRA